MKIQRKLVLYTLVITGLSLIFLGLSSFTYYYTNSSKEMKANTNMVMNQAMTTINHQIDELDILTEKAQFYSKSSYNLMNDLHKYNSTNYSNEDTYHTNEEVRGIFSTLLYRTDYINFLAIITPNGHIFSYSNTHKDFSYGFNPLHEKWYKEAVQAKGDIVLNIQQENDNIVNGKGEPTLFFTRAVYDFYSRKLLGVMLVNCETDYFDFLSEDSLRNIKGFQLIKATSQETLYENINDSQQTNSYLHKETLTSKKYPVKITAFIDYSSYHELLSKTLITIIIILLSVLFASFIPLYYFSKRFTSPIIQLSRVMGDNSRNNVYTIEETKYTTRKNEIGTLYKEYEKMIVTLNQYLIDKIAYEKTLLKTEMDVYKNQIDSHFLYNTLESINSLAELENMDDISSITLALSDMFRYASNGFVNESQLSNELKHVEDYLKIQEIRYQKKLNYKVFMHPAELYYSTVPKLILQPLIENAINHGFNRGRMDGQISVNVSCKENDLLIQVCDNGKGMSKEQLDTIRKQLKQASIKIKHTESHIGLINIQTRLVLTFGEKYGLSVESQEMKGTTVSVLLPISLERTENYV
ncbi:histidine kinase [Niallia taxi]|uniref:Histidine kinase domain-containing protein n=1 Tax=Niallia taxi TaxID=2499688 RepID=A0A3S3SJF7_9BACI|nr:histidine kinase [Niallia taxi]RVT60870.1 hypothetical protein EM808_16765 [Niallia taxi]